MEATYIQPGQALTTAQALLRRQQPKPSSTPTAHRLTRHLDTMVQELQDQRQLLQAAAELSAGPFSMDR